MPALLALPRPRPQGLRCSLGSVAGRGRKSFQRCVSTAEGIQSVGRGTTVNIGVTGRKSGNPSSIKLRVFLRSLENRAAVLCGVSCSRCVPRWARAASVDVRTPEAGRVPGAPGRPREGRRGGTRRCQPSSTLTPCARGASILTPCEQAVVLLLLWFSVLAARP